MTLPRLRLFPLAVAALATLFALFISFAHPALADSATATISAGLNQAAEDSYSQGSLTSFIGKLISALLGATGVVFLILTVYAGILYMTAMGVPDKVKKSKQMLTEALIGLIIIVGAYALTSFVVSQLTQASQATTTCSTPPC